MSTDGTSHEAEEKDSAALTWCYRAVSTWCFLIHEMDLWDSMRSLAYKEIHVFKKHKVSFWSAGFDVLRFLS